MILMDTNVVIDARDPAQPSHAWAVAQIERAVAGEGGGINAVTLAELCAGSPRPAHPGRPTSTSRYAALFQSGRLVLTID